jgi:uncharacterized membrane protein YGL010W
MRTIDKLLNEYGESHQNGTNKIIHWICIPLIMFSLVGVLWSIPFPKNILNGWITIGSVVIMLSMLYYIRLSIPLFVGFLGIGGLLIVGNYFLFEYINHDYLKMFEISFIIFFLAWVGQFYGHKIEGKKPSFLKDLQFLLIGPAWLLHFIYKKIGINY